MSRWPKDGARRGSRVRLIPPPWTFKSKQNVTFYVVDEVCATGVKGSSIVRYRLWRSSSIFLSSLYFYWLSTLCFCRFPSSLLCFLHSSSILLHLALLSAFSTIYFATHSWYFTLFFIPTISLAFFFNFYKSSGPRLKIFRFFFYLHPTPTPPSIHTLLQLLFPWFFIYFKFSSLS